MTSMCSNGQYAAFSVNKMHIFKNYILFPIKCTQTTHNSNKITSQKKYNNKTTFSRKYFPILVLQPNGKVTLVCGQNTTQGGRTGAFIPGVGNTWFVITLGTKINNVTKNTLKYYIQFYTCSICIMNNNNINNNSCYN